MRRRERTRRPWDAGRIMAMGLALVLSAAAAGEEAVTAPRKVRKDLKVEDLGTPIKRRELSGACVFQAHDGATHLFLQVAASNGFEDDPSMQYLDFNLQTKKVQSALSGIVNGSGRMWFHPNGKLYLGGGRPCSLIEFDPATGKARFIGLLAKNFYHAVQSVAIAPDGALYFGLYGRHASRYDPKTDTIEDLGAMDGEGNTYVYSIAADGRYVYCGMSNDWYLVVYDTQTKTQQAFHDVKGSVGRDKDGNIVFGNVLLKDGKPVPPDQAAEAKRAAVPVPPDGALDIPSAEKALGLEFDISDMEPNQWNNGRVSVKWRAKGTEEWSQFAFEGVAIAPNPPSIMAATPEGKLIGMGAHYGPIFLFDPETGKSELIALSPCSIDAFLVKKDVIYFCGYSAQFWIYDRTKPWTLRGKTYQYLPGEKNPVNIGGAGKWPDRLAEGADGRIYSTGNHGRHLVGGDGMIYDPVTKQRVSLRGELEAYNTRDLRALDAGRLIVWSAKSREGKGATMFVHEAEKKPIARQFAFSIESEDPGMLMPAGRSAVIGVVRTSRKDDKGQDVFETLLYKLDVATTQVLFQKKVPGKAFAGPLSFDYGSTAREICVGPDGCGWLFIDNNLTRIHPDGTVEKVLEMKHGARMVFLGDDMYLYNGGRQFYGGFANILRIRNVFE